MIVCHIVRPAQNPGEHEFLQLRRSAGDYLGGTWQTVRGRIEGAETAWQAALRELREECNLIPAEFYKLSTLENFYLAHEEAIWHVPCFCVLVGRDQEVKLNGEHDAYRWVPRDKITDAVMWPGEREALKEIFREILGNGLSKPFLRLTMME
jgi:dATP pyrophosphohydrolase